MDLHSDSPYWLMKNGMLNTFPSLQENKKADIVVIGAGITGAIIGYHLHQAGLEVMLVDKRHVATGSTCASTALLQYEIDMPLTQLAGWAGEQDALRSYRLCLDAIGKIRGMASTIGHRSLELKPSLQYASFKKDVRAHYQEYLLRKKNRFPVNWLPEKEISELYGFSSAGAILSSVGAQMDPYAFTHDLLRYLTRNQHPVYDATEIKKIVRHKGRTELVTDLGYRISTKQLIVACGYESQHYLPKQVGQLKCTYAIISEPLATRNFWHRNSLIWETADPYLYLRTTPDRRIIIGGKDDDFSDPRRREDRQQAKSKSLLRSFQKLMPSIPFKMDLSWSGTFSGSKDGLPFIGSVPERRNTFFALGFGGNGIVFSVVAAGIITDLLLGNRNADAGIFRFNR